MKSTITILGLSAIVVAFVYSCDTRTYDEIGTGAVNHPTYEKDIKPVMTNNCISCHQAGIQNPDLTTYENVKANANAIYSSINDGSMPQSADKLPSTTIKTFQNWIQDGMPQN